MGLVGWARRLVREGLGSSNAMAMELVLDNLLGLAKFLAVGEGAVQDRADGGPFHHGSLLQRQILKLGRVLIADLTPEIAPVVAGLGMQVRERYLDTEILAWHGVAGRLLTDDGNIVLIGFIRC